jgi:hypothetical protein
LRGKDFAFVELKIKFVEFQNALAAVAGAFFLKVHLRESKNLRRTKRAAFG